MKFDLAVHHMCGPDSIEDPRTHLLSLKFQSEVGNSNSSNNVGAEAAWDIGHLPLLCITNGGCNGRQHRDPVRGVPPLGERDTF